MSAEYLLEVAEPPHGRCLFSLPASSRGISKPTTYLDIRAPKNHDLASLLNCLFVFSAVGHPIITSFCFTKGALLENFPRDIIVE